MYGYAASAAYGHGGYGIGDKSHSINTGLTSFAGVARTNSSFQHAHFDHQFNLNSSCNNLDNSMLQNQSMVDPIASLSQSYSGMMPTRASVPNLTSMMPPTIPNGNYGNREIPPHLLEFVVNYNKWWNDYSRMLMMRNNPSQRLTPYKFGSRHSPVAFGCNNQLITVCGTAVIIHKLKSTLIEAAESTLINTWPGPLRKDETAKEDVLEYIKGQERCSTANLTPEYYYFNIEKRQLWQLLTMMVKQSGILSSSELAEFLINNNEDHFGENDLSTEIGRFRRFLLLGQRKIALDFARKSGLWGHKFALAYLTSNPHYSEAMVSSVNDFVDSTLSKDDPIFTLYRCLLQQLQKHSGANSIGNMVPPSNLQQFTILLANGCNVNPAIGGAAFNPEVLKLIVGLRNNVFHYIDLNNSENYLLRNELKPEDRKYGEEILFMNEIYEFACRLDQPMLQIVPFKTVFACKLYDYGLFGQSRKYCESVRNAYDQYVRYGQRESPLVDLINWDLVLYLIDSIENRLDQDDNFPSIHYAYSPTFGSSSQVPSTPANGEQMEEYGRNSQLEVSSMDSRLEELHLNQNLDSPIKFPSKPVVGSTTGTGVNRDVQFRQSQPEYDQLVDNQNRIKSQSNPFSVGHSKLNSASAQESPKVPDPSPSLQSRTPSRQQQHSAASTATTTKSEPLAPSFSAFTHSASNSRPPFMPPSTQTAAPAEPRSPLKEAPKASKATLPMPTFYVPGPIPESQAPPAFDFVSQQATLTDIPLGSDNVDTANGPAASQAFSPFVGPDSFPPPPSSNNYLANPFDSAKDAPPSLNSTTANGFAGQPYMYSPAMSPIASPDPSASYHYKDTTTSDNPTSKQAQSAGPLNEDTNGPVHSLGTMPNEKSKGLFTSLNSW